MEEIGRSGYKIRKNRKGNTVFCLPLPLPEEDQRGKKEVKTVLGNCLPINHTQDNLNILKFGKNSCSEHKTDIGLKPLKVKAMLCLFSPPPSSQHPHYP